jgi:cyanate lyase
MTTRPQLTDKIRAAKRRRNVTWREIAAQISPSASPVQITAALLGQMRLTADEAAAAVRVLELDGDDAALLSEIPYRGSLPPGPPTDPLIYRFYELITVYGTTWKALIEEEFGDGIMSAIDFDMTLERAPDPKGDRVRMTLNGKFLPYRRY